ncbi:hypothetical protein [Vibrio phage BONAISHI]|nr:hypothetical protein [Vibrio phage BONAISHI]
MRVQRAMVVRLPVNMVQELDDYFEESGVLAFETTERVPVDVNGLGIGDYFHRYLASLIGEIGTTHYWRPFEAMSPIEAREKLKPVIGYYDQEFLIYARLFNQLSPFFSIEFLDLGTILVKEEFGYVIYPQTHSNPEINTHPDIHTASYFSLFYRGPANYYLYGVP